MMFCVAAMCAAGLTGCKKPKRAAAISQEDAGQLRSTVHAADAKAAAQFVRGFHEVEQNSWRWTTGRFAVTLRPPATAKSKGATLVLEFAVPDPVIEKVKTLTLAANVNGAAIAGETYTKGGSYSYRKDVPASALQDEAVGVDFALDQFIKAGEIDARELGVIVSSAGLEAK
jgi:hypothetical protein